MDEEQNHIEEGKIKPLQYVGVTPDTYTKLVRYLQARPYAEVAALLSEMAKGGKTIQVNE